MMFPVFPARIASGLIMANVRLLIYESCLVLSIISVFVLSTLFFVLCLLSLSTSAFRVSNVATTKNKDQRTKYVLSECFLHSRSDLSRRFDYVDAGIGERFHFFRRSSLPSGNDCSGMAHTPPGWRRLPGDKGNDWLRDLL